MDEDWGDRQVVSGIRENLILKIRELSKAWERVVGVQKNLES